MQQENEPALHLLQLKLFLFFGGRGGEEAGKKAFWPELHRGKWKFVPLRGSWGFRTPEAAAVLEGWG